MAFWYMGDVSDIFKSNIKETTKDGIITVNVSVSADDVSDKNTIASNISNAKKGASRKYTQARNELAREVSRLARIANKRLDRLEKSAFSTTSAYNQWKRMGGQRFRTNGMSYQQLQQEYWRVQNFLQSETSTIKGARQYINNILSKVGGIMPNLSGVVYSDEQMVKMASNYYKLLTEIGNKLDEAGETAKKFDSFQILKDMYEYFEYSEGAIDDLLDDSVDLSTMAEQILAMDTVADEMDLDLW